ncbi:MAG: TetR/AcrR family transcriptional regulator [Lachnospiraceae bacterium]|nr:TetR/AcrR family transcriptional regulator [Lachnospiraceae bacterium]
MRSKEQDALQMDIKRRDFLELGFKLFSEKTIEMVNLTEVAEASPYGTATLYRYFAKKPGFVVAVAAWKWGQFKEENQNKRNDAAVEKMTAAEMFEIYLDSFLTLYKEHRDLLRFNQYFNIYVVSEKLGEDVMKPYEGITNYTRERFHVIYSKALKDKTLRTDMPEEEMFSVTLHLMLAVVTRYAVGLVYKSGTDEMKELELQKK